jgi:hypothetical protein
MAALIGEQITQKDVGLDAVPISIKTGALINLSKIYLEHEHRFGDRGVLELVKSLQHNTTVRVLSLKDCNLGPRAAKACARCAP